MEQIKVQVLAHTDAEYQSGWAYGVGAWLMDPCARPSEDDVEAFQRIREACWETNKEQPPAFWEGFKDGIETEFGLVL